MHGEGSYAYVDGVTSYTGFWNNGDKSGQGNFVKFNKYRQTH